uniref:DCN1-like protein 3 n=1 Tax=Myxine glutinosa TaxID=7769 RepID=UPI00358E44C8
MGQCISHCCHNSRDSSATLSGKNDQGSSRPPSLLPRPAAGPPTTPGKRDSLPLTPKECAHSQVNGQKGPSVDGTKLEPSTPIANLDSTCLDDRIAALFARYCDPHEDAILADGMERFCNDLHVDPAEFIVLVLAWKFQASAMCRFIRSEFMHGCRALGADGTKAIQASFPELLREARQDDAFKELYRFTFQFGLDVDEGQRALPREMALPLWRLVFSQHPPPILECWLDFLSANPTSIRGISRDTWNMFLNFTQAIGSDLDGYSEDEAWPSLFDAFVDWELRRRRPTAVADGRAASGQGGQDVDPIAETDEKATDVSGAGLQQG